MKNIIKNLITVGSSLLVAGAFFVAPTTTAFAYVDMDVNGHEAPNVYLLSGKNHTDNPTSTVYSKPINAKAGDTIKLQVHYHNFNTNGELANNVRMSVSVPSGSATRFTISANLSADNSIRTYADTTVINLSSSQSLSFVSGSVVWYPGFSGATALPNGQSGDSVVTSGVNVGNVQPGNSSSGYIYLRLLVSNATVGTAPSVTTNSASSIGETYATLNGSVNPNGDSTNDWFEYSSSYSTVSGGSGTKTSEVSAGSGNSSVNMSASASGLAANTTYYYRAAARNNYGTTYGNILSFSTPSIAGSAPSVTTNSASNIGETYATMNGSVNPNNYSTYDWFEYSTNSSTVSNGNGTKTGESYTGSGSSSSNVSRSLTGLSANTTYYYRAAARNTYGTTYGSVVSFTTSGTSGSAPSVTTNSASNTGETYATLNGSVNPNSASTNDWFEYSTNSSTVSNGNGTRTSESSTGSGSSNVNTDEYVSGLSSNTTYYYRAAARNTYGTTYGSVMSFTTNNTSGSSPSVTTNSASNIGETYATVNGSVNPNNSSTYDWFEYSTNSSTVSNGSGTRTGESYTGSGSSSVNVSRALSNLSINTTYYYRAAARNTYGTTYGSVVSFTTSGTSGSAPSVTTNSVSSYDNTSATLRGTVNPNNSSTYDWFEYSTNSSTVSNGSGTRTSEDYVGSGNSNQDVSKYISGLSNNTTYYYRAAARNTYGTTYGSVMSFSTSGGSSGSSPIVNTNSASSIDSNSETLRGTVNPNNSSAYDWFEYSTSYSTVSNGNGSRTSEDYVGSGNYTQDVSKSVYNLSSNTTYYYRAAARNSYGTTYGNILNFTTGGGSGGCLPTVSSNSASFITENSASLRGTINPNGRTTTGWFEYGTNSSLGTRTSYQELGAGSYTTDLIRYVSSLNSNTTYYYRAVAENSCGVTYGTMLSFSTTGSSGYALVNTKPATSIGQSYAMLNGEVNPRNADATSWFEYGTDSSLNNNQTTPSFNVGYGDYYRSTSYALTWLSADTTYYFRAVARTNQGTVKGSILSFRTSSGGYNPPTPGGSGVSISKEVKNLTFPNGTQFVNSASIGDVIEYDLIVKNISGSTVNSVTVKDSIPTYYDVTETNPSSSLFGNDLTWNIGPLSPDESRTIVVKVKARTVEQSVVVYNSFTTTSNGVTKTSNKTTTILNPSMMAIDISADKGTVDKNGTINYNIRYRNIGINDVDNVVIKVALADGLTFVSSNPNQSSSDGNVYFYRIGRVSRNQNGTINVQVKVNDDRAIGERLITTTVLDYSDIFGTPQRNISVASTVDVGSGISALTSAVGFSFGGAAWWVYLLWFLIILLILAIVYLYFKISKLLNNNY